LQILSEIVYKYKQITGAERTCQIEMESSLHITATART
jgi:hypothetical protein